MRFPLKSMLHLLCWSLTFEELYFSSVVSGLGWPLSDPCCLLTVWVYLKYILNSHVKRKCAIFGFTCPLSHMMFNRYSTITGQQLNWMVTLRILWGSQFFSYNVDANLLNGFHCSNLGTSIFKVYNSRKVIKNTVWKSRTYKSTFLTSRFFTIWEKNVF